MKHLLIIAVLAFSSTSMANFGNSIIIKTNGQINMSALGFNKVMMSKSPIISGLQIHQLRMNPAVNVQMVLAELRQNPQVVYAQLDHKVTMRQGPDDPEFPNQWAMTLDAANFGIDALGAWLTFGTGGKDISNNDIVVAIVDGGVEVEHPDLAENIWVNTNEIPGNGIDDDKNGYIDDINGWNAYNDSGNVTPNYHGTHVAGIAGARGNNGNQIVGVNWDVKIMAINGSSGTTSTVLRAYGYVLDQKKLWLNTDGAEGANVVATNSSFGIDFADCNSANYAAWNDIYEEMGQHGILSAAATMNRSADVDAQGDVPTGCSSPFVIAVTNTGIDGNRAQAAYGQKSIDLAAPGQGILSTVTGGSVSALSGTSMATPHVAGTVAFLHSVASTTLIDLSKADPAAAALEFKDIILSTVTDRPALASETVSGGILNLFKAAEKAAYFGLPGEVEEEEEVPAIAEEGEEDAPSEV